MNNPSSKVRNLSVVPIVIIVSGLTFISITLNLVIDITWGKPLPILISGIILGHIVVILGCSIVLLLIKPFAHSRENTMASAKWIQRRIDGKSKNEKLQLGEAKVIRQIKFVIFLSLCCFLVLGWLFLENVLRFYGATEHYIRVFALAAGMGIACLALWLWYILGLGNRKILNTEEPGSAIYKSRAYKSKLRKIYHPVSIGRYHNIAQTESKRFRTGKIF